MCFRHGWGIPKDKPTAIYYFQLAADMGDVEAQLELGYCYYAGDGIKKDLRASAKYYKFAESQGVKTVGTSWIYKKKYEDV